MKESILKFIQKYNITTGKIVIFFVLLILFIIRYMVQDDISFKPVQLLLDLYSDTLILLSRTILYFFNQDIIYDFARHHIINNGTILKIGRFYFSINQIVTYFIVVLITKSPIQNKIKSFLVGLFILTLYNSIRISIHALFPNTISVHNWAFNLILIPRWIIAIVLINNYWNKFPETKEVIKRKLGFSDKLIQSIFLKISIIFVIYHLVVIITFNNYFFINGDQLISFILKISKIFIGWIGYDCWIKGRLIYGIKAALYMDDACLGIDLMFLFSSFIVLVPGPSKHKLWYIPLGISIIIMLNCLRVILIFVNLSESLKYTIPMEIHDVFTYPVLVFTLLLWIIWVNKFLKLKKEIDE